VVWTDRLTDYEHYQAKCYSVEPVPGQENQYIARIATTSTCSKKARSPT